MHIRELAAIGFTIEQATALQKKTRDTDAVIPEYRERIYNRARLNGKPVSVFTYPDFVPDTDIETYSGKFAYGFDLHFESAQANIVRRSRIFSVPRF
jgi:hypothetical protein